jgi:hypothetical protein
VAGLVRPAEAGGRSSLCVGAAIFCLGTATRPTGSRMSDFANHDFLPYPVVFFL